MPAPVSVTSEQLPACLEEKCQALLEDIQRAGSIGVALLTEQRAAAFTEALEWLQVLPPAELERLYELYQRALAERIATLGH